MLSNLTQAAESKNNIRIFFILIVVLLLTTTFLRLINLDADPVPWFTGEIGYQIDEGYKTLSPRNLYLYGETHWNAEDEYRGWMVRSALTQWPYYVAFKIFGEELSSARIVSIIYAVLFLIITALFLWHRLPRKFAVLGVLLLATDPALFLYSRSALFETSIIFYLYAGIFISAALADRLKRLTFIPLIIMVLIATFYLKASVLLYILPVALSIGFIALRARLNLVLRQKFIITGLILILITGTAVFINTKGGSALNINLDKYMQYPQTIFLNPVHMLSPLALIISYMIIVELLIRRPKFLLENWYRLALAALLLIEPIMMSFFTYNVPRYHLPILPAAFLLIVERLNLDMGLNISDKKNSSTSWFSIERVLAIIVFLALSMTIIASSNYYLLNHMPINLGADPGLSDIGLLKIFPFALILFVIVAIFIAKRYWTQIDTRVYKTLIVLHILIGLGITITAIAFPAYQAQEIKHTLSQHIQPDESVGGDWAPFFVADTKLRGLYMRPDFNSAKHVEKLRPDYFLHSSTAYDNKNFTNLKKLKTIKIGNAIELGTFAKHTISLYSLEYLQGQEPTDTPIK